MEFTKINDLDNLILKYIRNIQEIDNSNINDDIKHIEIDKRIIFNFHQKIIYYNKTHYGQYIRLQKILMPTICIYCGNYMKHDNLRIKCQCKDKEIMEKLYK